MNKAVKTLARFAHYTPSALVRWAVRRNRSRWLEESARTPYFSILGRNGSTYMDRYWLFRDREFMGERWDARVHVIYRSDADRHLHDHPYDSISVILHGWYCEQLPGDIEADPGGVFHRVHRLREVGAVVVREAHTPHRLVVSDDAIQNPCVSLFIVRTSEKRSWGFWTEQGWVHWRKYLTPEEVAHEDLGSEPLMRGRSTSTTGWRDSPHVRR